MNKLTNSENESFNNAEVNYTCDKQILEDKKVKDHDHYTGQYLGAAHWKCNMKRNYKNYKIPVFIHNNKGYDAHLIIKEIANYKDEYIKKEKVRIVNKEFESINLLHEMNNGKALKILNDVVNPMSIKTTIEYKQIKHI